MSQKIPDEGPTTDGRYAMLFYSRGDLSVRLLDAKEGKSLIVTHHSHHPFAVNHFREVRGLDALTYERPIVAKYPNTVDDGHEHDWEWVDPDDDDSKAVYCTKCGTAGEVDDDDD